MEDFWTFVDSALEFLVMFPWLQALSVVILFLLLAFIADKLITGIISRLVKRTETDLDDRLLTLLHKPIFSTVALIGLIIATHILIPYPDGSAASVRDATVAGLQTFLIIIWVSFGLRLSRILLGAMRQNEKRFRFVQQNTEPILKNALAVLLFVAGAYAFLLAWDIEVTALVASAGIMGLALSFAAQDTLANLFAGVAILTDRPYQIGHYIILDSGERGQVTHIGLRSTRLLTRDDVEVSIPNSVMGNAKIVNEAGGPPRRYRIRARVGVAYGTDIDKVMKVLLDAANNHPKVLQSPEPRARFRTFGDSSLDFDLLCWIEKPADRGLVTHELNCVIYKQFEEVGISIPFPQQDIYIKEIPDSLRNRSSTS